MIIYSYIGNTHLPMLLVLLAPFSTTLLQPPPPPPPPPPTTKKKKNLCQIWILCQNFTTRELKIRVVGFVLKKLLTFFENLIVPHALHCINGCFFSSPKHEVLMVSYCDQFVRRPCVVNFLLQTTSPPKKLDGF